MSRPVSKMVESLLEHRTDPGSIPSAQNAKGGSTTPTLFVRRHSRLMRVAGLLDADSTTEPEILAKQLGIGRRTLYRDLALLRRAGVRLNYCREEQRYRVDSLYMRLSMRLTQEEAEAFVEWSTRRAKRVTDPARPLNRAMEKISRILFDELNGVRKLG